ncbi:MAG TPA: hypothetical protein PKD99_04555 [Sphingopyxis sp.]|nr:hypothetical protein [Sphingopyxis sp.]HMP44356.1 hypothetical protein [Sphingopyxis sp.]HMQ18222.1 hypothetical protein [Sphingopyxis sp.]
MRAFIGWLFALVPVAYIGWLLWHFAGVGGDTMEGIVGIGLGPTVLGLSIVGLLFLIGPLVKMIRVASGANKVPGGDLKVGDELPATEGFDADAALARYMSKRGEIPATSDEALSPPATRPQFGRKVA